MKKSIKKKWLKALRTPVDEGGYVQTTKGYLYDRHGAVDTFCCLGVLSNLCNLDGGITIDGRPNQDAVELGGGYGHPAMYEWAGIDADIASHLATKNDDLEWSFAQIADYIEENL